MLRQLFSNQWKSALRSPIWKRNIFQSIILGFFGLYFLLTFLGLGFLAGELIAEFFPDAKPLTKFTGFMLYYLLADILMRFFLQKFPSLAIRPYLTLPVKKKSLAHYLLTRSVFSYFNLLPLFALIPFYFMHVINEPTVIQLSWIGLAASLILLANYVSYFIDRQFGKNGLLAGILLAILCGIMYLDFSGRIVLSEYLDQWGNAILHQPLLLLVPITLIVGLYYIIFNDLKNSTYLEDQVEKRSVANSSPTDIQFFDRFGAAGELMDMELKLIWRNKRTKAYLFMSLAFLLFPLIYVGEENFSGPSYILLMSLLMTGAFTLNYGQVMLSWNSLHFDFLLTKNIEMKDFFKAKFYLMAISNAILTLFSFAYAFVEPIYLPINLALFFYNTGVTFFIYMVVAFYSSQRIDPMEGGAFSFQGFGAAHFLIIIPICGIVYLIYWPLAAAISTIAGVVGVGLVGLIITLFHSKCIDLLLDLFRSRKYKIASAFRKK